MSIPNEEAPSLLSSLLLNDDSDINSFNPILVGSNNTDASASQDLLFNLPPGVESAKETTTTTIETTSTLNNNHDDDDTILLHSSPIVPQPQQEEDNSNSNIMSESKLSTQDKQSLVGELSKAILGIYMNNVIKSSLKDKITETITDTTTANIISYYFKRREYLKQQEKLEQQEQLLEQNRKQYQQEQQQEGFISLDHPTNLDTSFDQTITIDLNTSHPIDNTITTTTIDNSTTTSNNPDLTTNDTSSSLPIPPISDTPPIYIFEPSTTPIKYQPMKDLCTDDENEEDVFCKRYMDDFRNDDLIVNKDEDIYSQDNTSFVDHFREAILLEWNDFKKPIEFKYEWIQTRIEQLKKEYNLIILELNEKQLNNSNMMDDNESTCSRLSGISNNEYKNNITITRSSELYNAFYPPYKRRLDFLQHPFFGSFEDIFNREIEHLKELKEKKTDLTTISSNWVSAAAPTITIDLNNTNNNGTSTNTLSNSATINGNNLKVVYPFPYITSLDILDSIELFKTSSKLYPPQSRARPLSYSNLVKYNPSINGGNKRGGSVNRRGRRAGRPAAKRIVNRSGRNGGNSSSMANASSMDDEEFVIYDHTSTLKDVKPAEITVPDFRILTNDELSTLPDEFSPNEDISDVKYCYLHIDKEMQERQKYYLASLTGEKKKKKNLDDSKNLHYALPSNDVFRMAFEKHSFKHQDDSSDISQRFKSSTNTATIIPSPFGGSFGGKGMSGKGKGMMGSSSGGMTGSGSFDDLSISSSSTITSFNNGGTGSGKNISTTTTTATYNEKLTYLVPIEDLQQLNQSQNTSAPPMNAKLAFQSKLTSPQKKKDVKKTELTATPRWKLITIESYVPYPILQSDARGNWEELKTKSLERRSNLSLDLNTDITNNYMNDIDSFTRKRAKSIEDDDLSMPNVYQPKKKSKFGSFDEMLIDEDTDEIEEDTDDDDFHEDDDDIVTTSPYNSRSKSSAIHSTSSTTALNTSSSSTTASSKKKKKSSSKKKKNQITTPVRVDSVTNDGTKIVFKLQK